MITCVVKNYLNLNNELESNLDYELDLFCYANNIIGYSNN